MTILLGSLSFDESRTAVREKYEEVGGRNARIVTLAGIVDGFKTVEGAESWLDAIMAAASEEGYVPLSLRPGRQVWVRRIGFSREVARETRVGSFELKLEARDGFEESTDVHFEEWPIVNSEAVLSLAPGGNAPALPGVMVMAFGTLIDPALGDGNNAVAYSGSVPDGHVLVFDCEAERVTLEGLDVTPYCTGAFPRLAPGGATLIFRDAPASSHTAVATVSFRDRWW